MRILIHVDKHPGTDLALEVGARLGANLWAHITLLAVSEPVAPDCSIDDGPERQLLLAARRNIVDLCDPDAPYKQPSLTEDVVPIKPGLFEIRSTVHRGSKDINLRVRQGDIGQGIITEAFEDDADLIIIGASDSRSPSPEAVPYPLTVATQAACSTLIIKEASTIENIIIGVENPQLNQTAREMFNQMATIFKAPSAMYPLPSRQILDKGDSTAMERLVKIFQAHDLNVITAKGEASEVTISEIYNKADHNMLILR